MLYPVTLAVSAAVVSLVAIVGASYRTTVAAAVKEGASASLRLATLPFDAISTAYRARSFALVGIIASLALIMWTAITSYFAPPWPHYDCLWYHDTIIGFTLQNHGFRIVSLPPSLARVNAYPRACEMTQLWFVIFTDRRLIELSNSLIAPAFIAGSYLLCWRFLKIERRRRASRARCF